MSLAGYLSNEELGGREPTLAEAIGVPDLTPEEAAHLRDYLQFLRSRRRSR